MLITAVHAVLLVFPPTTAFINSSNQSAESYLTWQNHHSPTVTLLCFFNWSFKMILSFC